jgi:hypothetical protein
LEVLEAVLEAVLLLVLVVLEYRVKATLAVLVDFLRPIDKAVVVVVLELLVLLLLHQMQVMVVLE